MPNTVTSPCLPSASYLSDTPPWVCLTRFEAPWRWTKALALAGSESAVALSSELGLNW